MLDFYQANIVVRATVLLKLNSFLLSSTWESKNKREKLLVRLCLANERLFLAGEPSVTDPKLCYRQV